MEDKKLSDTLSIPDEMSATTQKWNELYEVHNGVQYPHEQLVIYVSYLKQKAIKDDTLKALEVGFGAIPDLVMLHHKGYEVYGLEVSQNAVSKGQAMAASLNIPMHLQHWEPYALPFAEETFDLFCSSNSFHFNLDQDKALEEVARVLNQQGKLYITYLAPGHKFIDDSNYVGEDLIRFTDNHPVPKMRQMIMRFYDQAATLQALYERYFDEVRVTKLEYNILDNPNAYWIVTASKKKSL